jgi:rubrerythrin
MVKVNRSIHPLHQTNRNHQQEKQASQEEPRRGALCPKCKAEKLEYDGCLNLVCPGCGYIVVGAFT